MMIRYTVVSAALLAALLAGQAHAQAVVEDPGYCAQFYPNANCTNYGPGNPMYPGTHAQEYGAYPAHYAATPTPAPAVRHHRQHRAAK